MEPCAATYSHAPLTCCPFTVKNAVPDASLQGASQMKPLSSCHCLYAHSLLGQLTACVHCRHTKTSQNRMLHLFSKVPPAKCTSHFISLTSSCQGKVETSCTYLTSLHHICITLQVRAPKVLCHIMDIKYCSCSLLSVTLRGSW